MKLERLHEVEHFFLNNRVFICGYGERGKELEQWILIQQLEKKLISFVDKKECCSRSGMECILYSDLKNKYENNHYLVITALLYEKEIYHQLIDLGFRKDRIVTFSDYAWAEIINEVKQAQINDTKHFIHEGLKNIHANKRAFIIGNGPSLQIKDLEKLNGEITFATNEIFQAFSKTNWRPTYYVLADRLGARINFFERERIEWIVHNSGNVLCSVNTCVFDECWNSEYPNLIFYRCLPVDNSKKSITMFSEDVVNGVFPCGTCVYEMYQFAVYFGIKEIYLLGMDFSFANTLGLDGKVIRRKQYNDHASFINLDSDDPAIYNEKKIYVAHSTMKEYADLHGIKIYNATRGGRLDVFDRIEFDELIK